MKNKNIKTSTFNVRTDLAIETRELLKGSGSDEPDGIEFFTDETDILSLTHVKILNEKGSATMGKPIGNYITLESEKMKENDVSCHEAIINAAANCLKKLANINSDKNGSTLVVGLGNWNITPDALGPKVISKILVTRHIRDSLPEEINKAVKTVSAVSPGVMGITGIETGEIIKGIAEKVKPSLIIAIDALAARKTSRINAAIQMSDTGVCPGAGVGNKRMTLNEETLGVPVIAIGVPTVVDAATLVNDTMDRMLSEMIAQAKQGGEFYNMLKNLDTNEKYDLITEILNPYVGNMFVTPKEVDAVIDRLANIIANAINIALHPGVTIDDINRFVF